MTITRSETVLLVFYVILSAGFGYLSTEPPLVTPLWALTLIPIAGAALILISRSHPLAAFVGVLVLTLTSAASGSGAEALLVVVVAYRCAQTDRRGQRWLALGVLAFAAILSALVIAVRIRFGPPLLGLVPRVDIAGWVVDWLSMSTVIIVVLLIAALLGLNAGHRRRELDGLKERAEQMRRERDQQAHIAAALERERISREMHDVIAHSLAVMIAVADGAQASMRTRPDEAHAAISKVASTGRRTLVDMRRLLASARGDAMTHSAEAPQPGVAAIPALIEEMRSAGLAVRFEQTGRHTSDAVVGLTVYRIIQEALTNVLRHGRNVREVLVRLNTTDQNIDVLIEDRSAVASPPVEAGRGLVGIRERAAFYDGVVEAGPRPDGGWRVFVRLRTENR